MDNQHQNTNTKHIGVSTGPLVLPDQADPASQLADTEALSLNATPLVDEPVAAIPQNKPSLMTRVLRRVDILLLALLVLGGVGLVAGNVIHRRNNPVANSSVSKDFGTVQLALGQFVATEDGLKLAAGSVVINGPLKLNQGIVVTPSVQPSTPTAGQLYYDQNTNQLAYYNGTVFVPLSASGQVVQTLGGASGQITVGGGLSVVGNQLISATGVTSLGGQAGAITLGPGLNLTGSTLQNVGAVSIAAGANISVTNDGSGNYTITNTGAGTGTVTSGGGTAGTIPLFTASQNIENSILTQSGGAITVTGNLNVSGTTTLTSPLTVANGGTGATTLAANGVLVGNGGAAITSVTTGVAGQCLLSTVGAPAFGACPGGGGGVTSLNGLTGALSVANASGAGATITIDNATTAAKGIASFNATNFTVSSGAVNTIQDINTGASPTFTAVNTNSILPGGGTLTIGSAGNLTVQGGTGTFGTAAQAGTVAISDGSSNTMSIIAAATAANRVYTLPDAGGSANFCLSSGNCAAAGSAGGDLTGTYPNPTIAKLQGGNLTISAPSAGHVLVYNASNSQWENHAVSGDVVISETGVATIQANSVALGTDTTGNYVIGLTAGNGISVSGSAGEGWSPTVAVLYGSTANTAVQGNTSITVSPGTNLTGGGSITLGAGGSVTLNVANSPTFSGTMTVQGATITVGTTSQQGSIILNDGSSNTGTIQTAALGQDTVYTLPDPGAGTASICLTTGNCAGTGGGVTTPGGTTNRVSKFTGSQTLGDSSISDNGSTVTLNGSVNLVIQGGTSTLGTTSQAGTLVISDGSSNTISIVAAAHAANHIYTVPDAGADADFCLTSGNCVGGGGGGAPNGAAYIVATLDGTLTSERALAAGSNIALTDGGANGNMTVATVQNPTFTTSVTTPTLQSSGALVISSAAGTTVSINAGTTIELQDSTNVTGNLDVSGTLNAGTGNAFQVNATGDVIAATLTLGSPLTVANGGTGATSFTSNGVLYGNGSGAIQVTAAGTDAQVLVADGSGVPTFVSFSGDVTVSNTGTTTIQPNSVALGTDTTGNYVATIGTLTGLSTTGNSGEGSTPTLTVLYGSGANTAVQGNTTLTCPSGTGNLTGGGTSITLGTGGSCANLSTVNNPTFSTSVTTPSLILTGAGSNGTLQVASLGQTTTYTLPDPGAASASICLSTGNCTAVGSAGGDLTGTYPNPTIAKLQGTTLNISSPAAGHVLVYNASNTQWENHAVSGDIAISETGVATIQANSVALGTDTTGNYVATLGTLTGLTTTGNTGEGSTPTLSVTYGSGANTAVQGNTTLTCPSGTGNLTGGGTSITLGTGGTCGNLSTVNNPTFSTSVTTPSLILTGAGSNGTLQVASLGQTTTFTLPDPGAASASICLSTGNCSGAGSTNTLQAAYDAGNTILTTNNRSIAITMADTATDPNFTIDLQCDTSCGGNGRFAIQDDGTDIFTVSPAGGSVLLQNTVDSTTAFNIKNASPTSGNVFTVDTVNSRVGIGLGGSNVPTLASGVPGIELQGALRMSGTSGVADNFATASSGNVGARINIPFYAYSAGGQAIAVGVDSTANVSGRGITVFDARTSAHQPSIGVTSVDEQKIFGLSWDGASTTGYLKTNGASSIAVSPNATNAATFSTSQIDLLQNTVVAAGKTLTVTSALTSLTSATSGDALNVSNSTSTGNIAVFKDNATSVVTIGDGGTVLLQNETNQLSALEILTTAASGSHVLFNADTINERVGIGGVATASKFEIQGGDGAIYNNGNNPKLILGDSTTAGQNGFLMWDSTNDYFRIETVGTNGLKVKDNNVAIGNIFPSQPLIVGSGSTSLFEINSSGVATLIGGQTKDITTVAAGTATAIAIKPGDSTGSNGTGAAASLKAGDASSTTCGTACTGGVLTLQGGSATGASGTTRNGGNIVVDGGTGATANGSVLIGTNANSAITIGKSDATATITLGQSTASQTINIGNATTAAGNTLTVNVATSATSTGKAVVTIGNTNDGSSLALQAGTGNISLLTSGSITIGTSDTTGTTLVLDTKTNSGDPTGTDGAMYYNSSYKQFRCYFDGAWHYCNEPLSLSYGWNFYDDFIGGGGSSTCVIGDNNWCNDISGAAAVATGGTPEAGHPGILQLETGTATSDAWAAIYLGGNGGGGEPVVLSAGDVIEFDMNIATLSDASGGTNEYNIHAGFCDVVGQSGAGTSDCNDGVYFEYDRDSSANWRYATANGGTRTKTSSSTAVATGWHRFKIVVDSTASNVTFYVDGTSIGTTSTNIPTANTTNPALLIEKDDSTGSANRTVKFDYYQYHNSLTTLR